MSVPLGVGAWLATVIDPRDRRRLRAREARCRSNSKNSSRRRSADGREGGQQQRERGSRRRLAESEPSVQRDGSAVSHTRPEHANPQPASNRASYTHPRNLWPIRYLTNFSAPVRTPVAPGLALCRDGIHVACRGVCAGEADPCCRGKGSRPITAACRQALDKTSECPHCD